MISGMPSWFISRSVHARWKLLFAVVTICATLVDIQTGTHKQYFDQLIRIPQPSWAIKRTWMKPTGNIGVLRSGRKIEVSEKVKYITFDGHIGRRDRLWDVWRQWITSKQVKDVLSLHNVDQQTSYSQHRIIIITLHWLKPQSQVQ